MTAESLAEAIGRVFDREYQAMRERGYASLGPQVVIFSAFVGQTEDGLHLAGKILTEMQEASGNA